MVEKRFNVLKVFDTDQIEELGMHFLSFGVDSDLDWLDEWVPQLPVDLFSELANSKKQRKTLSAGDSEGGKVKKFTFFQILLLMMNSRMILTNATIEK